MGKKFKSKEEVQEERKNLDQQYESGLPDYLHDYLDQKEITFIKKEVYKERYSQPLEDRIEFAKERDKDFWENNYVQIKKVPRKTAIPVFEEPKRAEERVDQERDLTPKEIGALIRLCENDLYLFAIRYFPHYLKKKSSKLHRYLYKTFSRKLDTSKKRHRGMKLAIAAPRGNAKCEKWDSKIQKTDGSIVNIKDIKIGDSILSLDQNLEIVSDRVISKIYSGKKLVRDYTTRCGRKISITDDHRLFNIHGEVKAIDLKIGEKIATPRVLKCHAKQIPKLNKEDAIFLANMLAEGQYNITGAKDYLRNHNLCRCLSTNKEIPKEVFLQDNEFLKIFISRFIDTDGWVSAYNPCFGITLANEKLIDQLFTIFLRLGFQPVKQDKPNDKSGAWAVVIHGVDQLIKLSGIGLLLKQTKLLNTIEKFSNNNEFLMNLSNGDIYWDELVEVSDYYETDTYDIETEINHNFISDNIISHNSSIVSNILPIWCICYGKKNFIIMLSDTKGQAEDFLADVKRELELNEKLRRDFPNVAGSVSDKDIRKGLVWRTDEIITRNMVKVIALGTGSKIRGRKFGVHRPDLVICDDLENMEMVRSQTQRDHIREDWFDKDLNFVGGNEDDKANSDEMTDFFLVGTILGKDALLNTIINTNEYPDWQTIRFKAVEKFSPSPLWDEWSKLYKDRFDLNRIETARDFFNKNKEEMLKGTEVLWPDGDPYYGLMAAKLKNYSAFLSEKQNEPIDPSKVIVTKEELHFENFYTNQRIKEAINRGISKGYIFGAIDPSVGKKHKKGDPSCITSLVRDPQTGYVFVIYFDMRRRSVDKQVEDIISNHEKFHYKLFGIETNAFQYVLAESLRKKSTKQGSYVPIEEINNFQDKKMRIEGIVPFLKDGTIVFDTNLYNSNQMYNAAIEQICTFTGMDDSNDDAPDCLEMAFRIAKAPKFRMITSGSK